MALACLIFGVERWRMDLFKDFIYIGGTVNNGDVLYNRDLNNRKVFSMQRAEKDLDQAGPGKFFRCYSISRQNNIYLPLYL